MTHARLTTTQSRRDDGRPGDVRPPVLRTHGLTKRYGNRLAVNGLDLEVPAGVVAPSQDVATRKWLSLGALGDGLLDFGSVLFWVAGYALLGMTVAVPVRSVPVALAIGIAWIGPIEHILQDDWGPASRFFTGLLLEAFVAGGTSAVSAGRALATIVIYVAIAAVVAGTVFARRDVTA